jgi:hypothetical protein
LDAKPFISSISDKNASCLLTAFLHLAKGALKPGDLLWTPYEGFPELLEGKLKPLDGNPGIYIYDDV